MTKFTFRLVVLVLALPGVLFSQQVADTTFNPSISHPAYDPGKGPVIFIDGGHYNFHTRNGRFLPFTRLLERDGYVVKEYLGTFEKGRLRKGSILVISNALNVVNTEGWYLPTPSAFTPDEIETVVRWVSEGGSLFLIADHMPMAGAAEALAAAFGFEFTNGFAMDTSSRGPSVFKTDDHTLMESIFTRGRDSTETVRQVVTFTGQAFQIPDDAIPVLVFDDRFVNYLPDTAWQFHENTPRYPVSSWSQGAFKKYGKGRVVVFGEAAMFTAQLAGPQMFRVGMNSEYAPGNYKLLLNLAHWLDGKLD